MHNKHNSSKQHKNIKIPNTRNKFFIVFLRIIVLRMTK